MDGYTPGEGWTPLYDNPQPERKHTDADLAAEYERGRKAGLTQAYDAALAQQERQSHTEAEVQELLAFIGHYKAGTFDLGMIEQKVRRTLGVRL
jgi:hypothetical protein